MLKVTAGVMTAALGVSPSSVFAAGDGAEEAAAAAAVPLSRDELSLYAAPPAPRSRSAGEPAAGQLEQSVAALRTLAEPYAARCKGSYDEVRPRVQSAVRFGTDAYAYLKDPPKDFYPRAGVIGFAGVLGLLLARGSRVKRLLYPAGLVTVGAALYYPEQAAAIARSAGDSVYERAVRGYAAVEKMLSPRGKEEKSSGPEPKP